MVRIVVLGPLFLKILKIGTVPILRNRGLAAVKNRKSQKGGADRSIFLKVLKLKT